MSKENERVSSTVLGPERNLFSNFRMTERNCGKNRFVQISRSPFIFMSRFCQPRRNYLSEPGLLLIPFMQFWEKHPKFKLLDGIPACSNSYTW